jgi:tetratricopeptide (TPR) repeat protein
MEETLFISYKYDSKSAEQLRNYTIEAANRLRRLTIVDGKTLSSDEGFSTGITDFIKNNVKCVAAIFSDGDHGNANVIYELGNAVGAGKSIIIVAERRGLVPEMLKFRDVIHPPLTASPVQDLQQEIEKRLRQIFRFPDDQFVENKLDRRYSEEEKYMRDPMHVRLPIACIKVGDFKKAEVILSQFIGEDERDLDAIYLLSDTYYLAGCSRRNPEVREEFFRKQLSWAARGLRIQRNHLLCLHSQAAAHMRSGKLERSREDIERILSIDGDFSPGQYNAACVAALMRDKGKMIDHLEKAIAINPGWKAFAKEDPDFTYYFHDAAWQALVYQGANSC